ncbi:hypothetical protein QAD02_012338 [Eretmocerus hayati]|uniref:Uncharacterized protein n=1 Tax=Eretmocerus hayati TaxID=131215 RepID=A0ACC2NZG3_9HYME|nr:hypothetical protein QAD02_012338 [Eretmocerus hayati]
MENQESSEPQESDEARPTEKRSQDQLSCWLYVSRSSAGFALEYQQQQQQQQQPRNDVYQQQQDGGSLSRASLEEAIRLIEPLGAWHVSETHCGLIAGFAREIDADKLLQRGDFARIFDGPVQVARFHDRDSHYKQAVLLRDVPWAIPLPDLSSALARQGIATGNIERLRYYVRVEVLEPSHYEQLLRQGLLFYNATWFPAIPERWRNGGAVQQQYQLPQGFFGANCGPDFQQHQHNQPHHPGHQPRDPNPDDVLQCYRCQGFWHVAANCRQLPRCVRCGEPHSVEFCSRPRNNPICCHCSGPHHAGYRQCPVRLQLLNATPVSLTLSTNRLSSSNAPSMNGHQLLLQHGKSNGASNASASGNNSNNNAAAAANVQTQNQKPS